MQKLPADFIQRSRVLNKLHIPQAAASVDAKILWFHLRCRELDYHTICKKMHRHTYYEVHFQYAQETVYQLSDGNRIRLSEGEFLLLPPGCEHAMVDCGETFVRASLAFMPDGHMDTPLRISFPEKVRVGRITETMESALQLALASVEQAKGVGSQLLADALCILMLLLASDACKTDQSGEQQEQEDIRVTRARQYICDNRNRAISVGEVARYVHLSERQLNRLAREEIGSSVSDIIRAARCEAVKEQLLNTKLTTAQIAEQLDFSNEYNLIRFFQNAEGMSPGRFRKSANMKEN